MRRNCYNKIMIARLEGKIVEVKNTTVIIKCGSIFFELLVANPFRLKEGEERIVYTYLQLQKNQDEINLYGFLTNNEKELFLKLITIPGLGPKTALGILSKDTPEDVAKQIENKNIAYLSKIPRIGVKMAQKIVIELSDKISHLELKDISQHEKLYQALKGLGYKDKLIKLAISKIEYDKDIAVMLRDALKVIGNV